MTQSHLVVSESPGRSHHKYVVSVRSTSMSPMPRFARGDAHLLPDLGIGSNLDPVRIERTTSDDFSGVSLADAWPFSGLLLLASRFCNLLDDHRWAIGKLGDEVELPTHRFDIAFEG